MLGEPNPELEVDENGTITKLVNVELAGGWELGETITGSEIEVLDLIYDEPITVKFYANAVSSAPDGEMA